MSEPTQAQAGTATAFVYSSRMVDRKMVNSWPIPTNNPVAKTARNHSLNIAGTILIREDVLARLESNYKAAWGRLGVSKAVEKGQSGTVTLEPWPAEVEKPLLSLLAEAADIVFKLRKIGFLKRGEDAEKLTLSGTLEPAVEAVGKKIDSKQQV